MKFLSITVLCFLFLSACSNSPNTGQNVEANPFEYCNSLELAKNSEKYHQCVTSNIQQICTSRGLTLGSEAFAKCDSNLRNATFVRQQMQIRGF